MKAVGWLWLIWVGVIVTIVADVLGYGWGGLTTPWIIILALLAPIPAFKRLEEAKTMELERVREEKAQLRAEWNVALLANKRADLEKPAIKVTIDEDTQDEHGRRTLSLTIENVGRTAGQFFARAERVDRQRPLLRQTGRVQERLEWERGGLGQSDLVPGEKDRIILIRANPAQGSIDGVPYTRQMYFMVAEQDAGQPEEVWIDGGGEVLPDEAGELPELVRFDTSMVVLITAVPTPRANYRLIVHLKPEGWLIEPPATP